jgi:hypothetical protein
LATITNFGEPPLGEVRRNGRDEVFADEDALVDWDSCENVLIGTIP